MKEVIKIESVQPGNPFKSLPPRLSTVVGLTSVIQTITKGHGGHLEVETEEGEGARFIIHLLNF